LKPTNIANQVFIGCPHKTVRAKYSTLIENLKKKYPLSFVLVGRNDGQNAEDLLKIIKDRLFNSSGAIFDATGGNANVSLEYGLAEAEQIPCAIYISQHKKSKDTKSDSAIISDLAGKRRNEYKQLSGLRKLLIQYSSEHSYTKRFEKFLKDGYRGMERGIGKSARALSLRIVHCLDGKEKIRRSDILQEMTGLGYREDAVDGFIRGLHSSNLIVVSEGRFSVVTIK